MPKQAKSRNDNREGKMSKNNKLQSPGDYTYDAFISYRHLERDRKWAKWLFEALETYKVPKVLQESGLPSRIKRIFRDEDELPTSTDLGKDIYEALIHSRFLIVICSSETPESLWVDKEISTFRELGRDNQIVALLIEGEPATSFPPSLRYKRKKVVQPDGSVKEVTEEVEPLAADVRPRRDESMKKLKAMALLRILACLLGCSFDDLRQREHGRQMRKRRRLIAAVATPSLALMIGGISWWDFTRLKVNYFNEVAYRWGVPEGIGKINKKAYSLRQCSYRFESRRGKIRASQRVNSAGMLQDNDDGESEWLIEYDVAGRIEQLVCKNYNDKITMIKEYKYNLEDRDNKNPETVFVDFKSGYQSQPYHRGFGQTITGAPGGKKSEITRYLIEFNPNGFAERIHYQNQYGMTKRDANGSYGKTYEYNTLGLVSCESEMDYDQKPKICKSGVTTIRYKRDKDGNIIEELYLNENGEPIVFQEVGWAKKITGYDEWGNQVEEAYFGINGEPIFNKDGYAKWSPKYDEKGNIIEESFFGVNGEPVLNSYGVAKWTSKYDEKGNMIEEAYFGINNEPVLCKYGYGMWTSKYDERGNRIEGAFFGIDGKPVLDNDGVAKWTLKFDEKGNEIEGAYFGVNGEPVLDKDGFAKFTYRYDEMGNRIEAALFGVNGEPVLHEVGVAKWTSKYDERENEIERIFIGVDGKSIMLAYGYAGWTVKYDDRGNSVGVSYFGVQGEPVICIWGYAETTFKYDEKGNQVETAYFDVDSRSMIREDGVAKYKYKYDEKGNIVEIACFGIKGESVLDSDGVSKYTSKFDERGNEIETAFFGVDSKPVLHINGYAKYTFKYDERGNRIEEAYFGIRDEPVLHKDGYAVLRTIYNEAGKAIKYERYGLKGELLETIPADQD